MESILDLETVRGIANFWETSDSSYEELARLGICPFPRPKFEVPFLTAELLTTLSDREYTEKYTMVVQWQAYAITELAQTKSKIRGIQNAIKHMKPAIRTTKIAETVAAGDKKPTLQEIDDAIHLDGAYLAEVRREQQALDRKEGIESFMQGLSKIASLFSRQVEIRRQEKEQERIENNMPFRGRGYR